MAAHWQEQLDALRSEHTKAIAKLHEDVQKAQMEAKKSADEAASVRRLSVKTAPFTVPSTASAAPSTVNSIAPSPAPSPVPQSTLLASAPDYTFSADHNAASGRPGAFSTTASTAQSSAAPSPYLGSPMNSTDQFPAVITIANSRNFSPKRTAESSNNPRYTNKSYVNRYASFEDPSGQKPSVSPAPVTANTGTPQQQQQQYQPYSYSTELKEDAHVPVQGALQLKAPSPEMWGIASGPNSTHSARSGAGTGMAPLHTAGSGSFSGNTSVASLRRDELIDPDDEHDGAYIPSEQAQQQRASINNDSNKAAASSSGGWSTAKKAMHNSFRMMRLPQSGNSSPMPPIASFPNTPTGNSSSNMPPPSPSATLQIPRAQVKPNPIRAAIRNDSLQRQGSSKGKSGGAYITPHATSYAVMPATGPGGGVPSPMVSPLTQQQHSFSFMSATKTSSRSKELVRESAREKFANTYTYQK